MSIYFMFWGFEKEFIKKNAKNHQSTLKVLPMWSFSGTSGIILHSDILKYKLWTLANSYGGHNFLDKTKDDVENEILEDLEAMKTKPRGHQIRDS